MKGSVVKGIPSLAEVATVTQRLAVLLSAGVAPASAWRFVAETSGSTVPTAAAGRADVAGAIVEASMDLPELERQGWRGLAAAWAVATDAGAPLAATLREYAGALRSLADAQRDAATALASPRATARLVLALPFVGLGFGALMGFDTLSVLFATPVGWSCLAVGGGLLLAARAWSGRLMRAARPRDATAGLDCDLMAIAVSGGASLDRARGLVGGAAERFGFGSASGRVEGVLGLSQRAGVPAAELLRAEAEEARRDARAKAQRDAAALSVRLMLPLGVCVLPAFLVLGVLPLMIAVLSSTVGAF